jgi:hypothetical protein
MQTVMPGRNGFTEDCAAWTCLFCSILCYYWTCLFCATPGRVCSTAIVLPGRTPAFSMLNTNFERMLSMRKIFYIHSEIFAKMTTFEKMEKAFCFNPNTDPVLFGR